MRLRAEVERVKASGVLGRSEPLNRLFSYLAEKATAREAPREIDIAFEALGRTDTFDVSQDATVRVYVHRLRGRLDTFYAATPPDGLRLLVPKGEYRLVLQPGSEAGDGPPGGEEASAPALPASAPMPAPVPMSRRRRWLAAGLVGLGVVAVALAAFLIGRNSADRVPEIATTSTWAPILRSQRMTFVVLGDYYMFGETGRSQRVERLVREFSINSAADLDAYIMRNPDQSLRLADMGLHFLPLSAAPALGNLLPAMTDARRSGFGRAGVTTVSQIAPDVVKGSNVVYVGYLSGLGLLEGILFPVSSFVAGDNFDEIVDRRTGRHYRADRSFSSRDARQHIDYGYFASLAGPTGNRIIIVGGTRDAGVVQASETAINPALLRALSRKAGSDTFEALYQVRTIGSVNVGSSLIAVRPLAAAGPAQASAAPPEEAPQDR